MFILKTKRLVLRNLVPKDWKLFYELMEEPETKYYMDDYLEAATEECARRWVGERISYNNEIPRHSYNLAIEFKGEPIGWIGIGEAESEEKKDLDFGYALKKSYWGKGFMTEALRALLKYCFKTMEIEKITGECETRNLASRKVMEKAGMTLEKRFSVKDKKTGQKKEKFRFFIERS